MPTLLLFAIAREAAGTNRAYFDDTTLDDLMESAQRRFGETFSKVVQSSSIWVNGEPASPQQVLSANDEVAVLPPVSGG